jgi:uncharacterized radical SAM protein YgiQ
MSKDFLPASRQDMQERGWEYLDFVLVSGDAYVDHPSFGAAVISRLLESRGYRVGIIAQPAWDKADDFMKLGRPRLAFLITAGNMDSMVNHFTASKRRRKSDDYSPDGKPGMRPDRASIAYCARAREAYKDVPVILGGVEASLRRLVHYDYWNDDIRRSMLIDAKADYLLYGMAEKQMVMIADCLSRKADESEIRKIPGICYRSKEISHLVNYTIIPGYDDIRKEKRKYATAFRKQVEENNYLDGKPIVQHQGNFYVIQTPPAPPLQEKEMDEVYSFPYTRRWHPSYTSLGGVPALHEVQFSITTHRGCFGACSFCAIHFHQGSTIQNRSEASILAEARLLTKHPDFKGIIHDVGGPTANMYGLGCKEGGSEINQCKKESCLYPRPCPKLETDHSPSVRILEQIQQLPGVKRVFVRSGVRYDLMMVDSSQRYFSSLCSNHVSGQLHVAPEHASRRVTDLMHKPEIRIFTEFIREFRHLNEGLGKQQYAIPYFIASHPGTTLEDAVELAEYMRDIRCFPEQVQDFTPTPGTLATAMYYTEINPLDGEPVYVPRSDKERAMQRALMQYYLPHNHKLVREALSIVKRQDLIGRGAKALVPPEKQVRSTGADEEKKKGRPRKPGKEGK